MDITPFVDNLRRDLLAAAEASGAEAREVAERLSYALDPAARLAIMEAVSQAAAEITAELPAGSVEARLSGRDVEFGVRAPAPPTPPPTPPAAPAAAPEEESDGAVARITLRLPEALKTKAEEAAGQAGQSLNTWLVEAVRAATRAEHPDLDLSAIPQLINDAMAGFDPYRTKNQAWNSRRMTGWL